MPGGAGDPRRPDRIQRYVPSKQAESSSADQVNAVGMVCSLLGLLLKVNSSANFTHTGEGGYSQSVGNL